MLDWFIIGFLAPINTGTVECEILSFTHEQRDDFFTHLPLNIAQTSLYPSLSPFTVVQVYSRGLLCNYSSGNEPPGVKTFRPSVNLSLSNLLNDANLSDYYVLS